MDNTYKHDIYRYLVDFGTGAGNVTAETLSEAQAIADAEACYTGCGICIIDTVKSEVVAQRRWWGVDYDIDAKMGVECEDPITFGSAGYYDDWDYEKQSLYDERDYMEGGNYSW